ncbi:MAG: adenylate/guanylate cyclase domain-containing protein [Gammaproteobacteria bacterium]
MRTGFWLGKKWMFGFAVVAFCTGVGIDSWVGNSIDYWIHDAAVVFQARSVWRYSAVVALDDNVPVSVGRKQSLPLFARATERLIEAGAKAVFLDARLPKEMEGLMPYAACIRKDGSIEWSQPTCTVVNAQCQMANSAAGNAPLKMNPEIFRYFKVAPYLPGQEYLPDFLLYDWEAEDFIPDRGLVALDSLTTQNTPIARWLDMRTIHAAVDLSRLEDPETAARSIAAYENETCDQGIPCRRIRLSYPVYRIQASGAKLMLPVSELAACDESRGRAAADKVRDKIVILQMTTPTEATDIIITPMTTALFGPHLLTPGAQYLVDSIETLLNEDHPREPHRLIRFLIFLMVAAISVRLGAYYPRTYLWGAGAVLVTTLASLCFLVPNIQLWPVTVSLLVFVCGAGLTLAAHLVFGFREGRLISYYMPRQIHDLLIGLGEHETFRNRRHHAIVLMSDLACYTKVTDMLKEPSHVLKLMNDYLGETSIVLQDKYRGWLESYLGDMVCYYWPYNRNNEPGAFQNALQGAIELSVLQKHFFISLKDRYQHQFDAKTVLEIYQIINAGIGLSSGEVVMGDLGPLHGVRKFGILGRPMNLTARIESLTRLFNTEIIITQEFLAAAAALDYPVRRLGCICVKGCSTPVMLYAVSFQNDSRFGRNEIEAWHYWLNGLEKDQYVGGYCPDIYAEDKETLLQWRARGLMDENGIWHLDEK